MPVSAEATVRVALSDLRRYGILMESDANLPSVTTITVGGPIRGSWWKHPKAHEIHYVTRQMASHSDVLVTKLVSRKVTYVHRKLWPAIVALGSARQGWQLIGLSSTARDLLALIDKIGQIRTDRILIEGNLKGRTIGDAARELEDRLLIQSQEVHTETGAHAKVLQTWKVWSKEARFAEQNMLPEDAKNGLEKVLAKLNSKFDAEGYLPWT